MLLSDLIWMDICSVIRLCFLSEIVGFSWIHWPFHKLVCCFEWFFPFFGCVLLNPIYRFSSLDCFTHIIPHKDIKLHSKLNCELLYEGTRFELTLVLCQKHVSCKTKIACECHSSVNDDLMAKFESYQVKKKDIYKKHAAFTGEWKQL